jgi:peptidyl-prolyl cis-trans isomerase D
VLLQGLVSDPVNLDENRLVMIKLKEHLPVAVRPLAEVRDEIITTLSDKLARENAEAKAYELLAALQTLDSDVETLATESGLEFGLHEEIKRNTSVPDAKLVQEVFRMKAPAAETTVQEVLPTSNGFALVVLTSVVRGSLEGDQMLAARQYVRVIENGNASQETNAIMSQLRAAADIEVFEDRIQ